MPKQLTITTTYNADSRLLQTVATMGGFIESDPSQITTKIEIATISLLKGDVISVSDQQAITANAARAVAAVNVELQGWSAASKNLSYADSLLAAGGDPVETFSETLDPTLKDVGDPVGTFNNTINPDLKD